MLKLYECVECRNKVGESQVRKILTTMGLELRCNLCGHRVNERLVDADEAKRIMDTSRKSLGKM